jgi:hypothetical protein
MSQVNSVQTLILYFLKIRFNITHHCAPLSRVASSFFPAKLLYSFLIFLLRAIYLVQTSEIVTENVVAFLILEDEMGGAYSMHWHEKCV